MRRQELAEDQVPTKKEKKMNSAALDEIGVGSFVHMKEDVTTTSYDKMNDEDVGGVKMTMRQGAMKKRTTEEFDLPHLHKRQYLKLQKTKMRLASNIIQQNYHPTSPPSMLNESQ